MGCEGCELWNGKSKKCYAGVLHRRFGGATKGYSPTFETLTYWPGRMTIASRWRDLAGSVRSEKPWLNGLPRLIFVSDMSDALSAVVPFPFLKSEIIDVSASSLGRRHRWLWLTKRPDRMARFSRWLEDSDIGWPNNIWVGTSITRQATTARIRHLVDVGNDKTLRFLSVEPQYEPIDLGRWLPQLNWVIHGGESGASACPFDLAWAHELCRQCSEHNVPYFLKQLGTTVVRNGRKVPLQDAHGGDWSEWPDEFCVRQMPRGIKTETIAIVTNPRRTSDE
jgi:protein gp37